MLDITRQALQALVTSPNKMTALYARDVLEDRRVAFSPTPAMDLALAGQLGGLLQAVALGDKRRMWQVADVYNKPLIAHLIPERIKERY